MRGATRRLWMVASLLSLMLIPTITQADAQYRVTVNGRNIESDVAPMLVNGRLLVPLRTIAEGLGAQVTFDTATNTAVIQTGNIGSTAAQNLAVDKRELKALNDFRNAAQGVLGVADRLRMMIDKATVWSLVDKKWDLLTDWNTDRAEMDKMMGAFSDMEQLLTESPIVASRIKSNADLDMYGLTTPAALRQVTQDITVNLEMFRKGVISGDENAWLHGMANAQAFKSRLTYATVYYDALAAARIDFLVQHLGE